MISNARIYTGFPFHRFGRLDNSKYEPCGCKDTIIIFHASLLPCLFYQEQKIKDFFKLAHYEPGQMPPVPPPVPQNTNALSAMRSKPRSCPPWITIGRNPAARPPPVQTRAQPVTPVPAAALPGRRTSRRWAWITPGKRLAVQRLTRRSPAPLSIPAPSAARLEPSVFPLWLEI